MTILQPKCSVAFRLWGQLEWVVIGRAKPQVRVFQDPGGEAPGDAGAGSAGGAILSPLLGTTEGRFVAPHGRATEPEHGLAQSRGPFQGAGPLGFEDA